MIPKNKNISVLHPYMNKKGGAVKMMIYLSNLLVLEGNNVKFYTFFYDKKLFSQDVNFEVIVSSKLKIAKEIRNSDYIIIGNSPMQFVGALSKILYHSGAKLIWWHHHYPWYYGKNTNFLILIKRYFEKVSLKYIDELLVNSIYLKESLEKLYSRKSKVLNPIVENIFIQNFSVRNNFSDKIIFAYGRWVEGKNINQVFDTYLYLKDKIPNLKLLVGGVGEELENHKKRFKTDTNISFLGLLDTKSIITSLKKTHVFLFPSMIDSFGMTIIEAQASGVPVIAFDIAGAKEIIINEKTGFLAKNGKDFTEKTYVLLNNDNLLKDFSKNSQSIAINYDENNFKEQLNNNIF